MGEVLRPRAAPIMPPDHLCKNDFDDLTRLAKHTKPHRGRSTSTHMSSDMKLTKYGAASPGTTKVPLHTAIQAVPHPTPVRHTTSSLTQLCSQRLCVKRVCLRHFAWSLDIVYVVPGAHSHTLPPRLSYFFCFLAFLRKDLAWQQAMW